MIYNRSSTANGECIKISIDSFPIMFRKKIKVLGGTLYKSLLELSVLGPYKLNSLP